MENIVKEVQISDELYESIKDFVVDPFDDTPETVIGRVVDIASKAKIKWSPLGAKAAADQQKEREQQPEEPLVAL